MALHALHQFVFGWKESVRKKKKGKKRKNYRSILTKLIALILYGVREYSHRTKWKEEILPSTYIRTVYMYSVCMCSKTHFGKCHMLEVGHLWDYVTWTAAQTWQIASIVTMVWTCTLHTLIPFHNVVIKKSFSWIAYNTSQYTCQNSRYNSSFSLRTRRTIEKSQIESTTTRTV